MSLLVDVGLLELDVGTVKPVPEAQPPVTCVKPERNGMLCHSLDGALIFTFHPGLDVMPCLPSRQRRKAIKAFNPRRQQSTKKCKHANKTHLVSIALRLKFEVFAWGFASRAFTSRQICHFTIQIRHDLGCFPL